MVVALTKLKLTWKNDMSIKELNATYKGVSTVGCVFRNTQYAQGHEQAYTYLVPEWCEYVDKGDLAIVEKNGIYSIVTIVRVDDISQIDPNATYRYKWLVEVVSPDLYKVRLGEEENLIKSNAQNRV